MDKSDRYAIGMLSGTSVDGIDVALVLIPGGGGNVRLHEFLTLPYPKEIREQVLAYSHGTAFTAEQHTRLHWALGHVFAQAAVAMLHKAQVPREQVVVIGSHGQTVQHLPEEQRMAGFSTRGTLQLGEAAVIAEKTGVTTVYDFRSGDMAAGGQGAPLISWFDYHYFSHPDENRTLLNIGGIANITVLPAGADESRVLASDTGPGNMLIDALCRHYFDCDYDRNGTIAASGQPDKRLLEELLSHPYFEREFPKTTGRELFGQSYVARLLQRAQELGVQPRDLIATVTALTAQSIARAVRDTEQRLVAGQPHRLIVNGGGVKNQTLMQMVRQALPGVLCQTTEAWGFPVDAKEAVCFAVLADHLLAQKPATLPAATGAHHPALTGKICYSTMTRDEKNRRRHAQ